MKYFVPLAVVVLFALAPAPAIAHRAEVAAERRTLPVSETRIPLSAKWDVHRRTRDEEYGSPRRAPRRQHAGGRSVEVFPLRQGFSGMSGGDRGGWIVRARYCAGG